MTDPVSFTVSSYPTAGIVTRLSQLVLYRHFSTTNAIRKQDHFMVDITKSLKLTAQIFIIIILFSAVSAKEAGATPPAPYKSIATLTKECRHWVAWYYNTGDLHRSEASTARFSACGAYVRGMMDAYNGLAIINLDTSYTMCIPPGKINDIIPEFLAHVSELDAENNAAIDLEDDSAWFVLAPILKGYSQC